MFERATREWANIAANGHGQSFDLSLGASYRQGIKQGLGRVFMGAIARIDDTAAHFL